MADSRVPNSLSRFQFPQDRVLVLDGAMGTQIQSYDLTEEDFHGLEGCNEYLVLSRPEVIQEIHGRYYAAGADVVETNTFGATSIVLQEYDIADKDYEINKIAAQLAKGVALAYSTPDKPRFVAGSIGPTTKLPTLGHIDFVSLRNSYRRQVEGLVDGGVDILLVETCQDLLQVKAALRAILDLKQERHLPLPVIVQVTFETTGTMLVGSDMATVIHALEPFEIDALGMNCATGPQEMAGHIRTLSQLSPFRLSCLPNAGIPENIGGKAHFHLSPEELANHLEHFVRDYGVSVVGGCCGTTPEHIQVLSERMKSLSPAPRNPQIERQLTSLYTSTPMVVDPPPVLVGERTNANGSKKFRDLLGESDYDALVDVARSQVNTGAHVLDVCTAYVGRDEVRDMTETIRRYNSQLDIPLMIDSTELPVLEAALQQLGGRAIVNSVNLEDGEERVHQVAQLCRDYGAALVCLTIDETGMAKTADKKLEVARRIYDICVHQHGMAPDDLVFDTLTFTLGSGDEEFRKAGLETIEGIRLIKAASPQVKTILGISNISFGLSPEARHALNSVFLHYAVEAGLDMAIINSKHIQPLYDIPEIERELCRRLVFDERVTQENGEVSSDPLIELMAHCDAQSSGGVKKSGKKEKQLPEAIEERLKYRIIHGEKTGLPDDLNKALESYSALDIINTLLLDGMKTVGELFGRGDMQLPFVLQSAEVMKAAVAHLEPHMEKTGGNTHKGTMVLATVKGDVHDIGKNLVDIILTNNGYRVVNLGIKQPIEVILQETLAHQANAIGMSGLLVKSTAIMKENLAIMRERGIQVPVLLGGAALTPRFVVEDCQQTYGAPIFYCADAFAGLEAMGQIMAGNVPNGVVEVGGKLPDGDSPYQGVGELSSSQSIEPRAVSGVPNIVIERHHPIPQPPFWGTQRVESVDLETLYPFVNTQALFAGQWQVKRGTRTKSEYEAFVAENILPEFEGMKREVAQKNLLHPQVIYGYFPCQGEGNDVVVYDPQAPDKPREIQRFTFPRGGRQNLCIADFFSPVDGGKMDVLAMQIVTVGAHASEYAQTLFEADRYRDYLYFHGFGVEMAEALAEYWHKRIRQELAIDGQDATDVKRLFTQGYQGSRYSFGYPACPNLEDQVKLFQLLAPERIGITLTDEYMLMPEQSTSALVAHHPQARYFDVREPVILRNVK